MVLMIDANVILDVLMNRRRFVHDSQTVWKLCETDQAEGYISALTFANLVYIMRKELTPEEITNVYKSLKLIFNIADLSNVIMDKAASMSWNDFEDAIQSATAEQIHADYIVTRNIRDFTRSRITAITPERLIDLI